MKNVLVTGSEGGLGPYLVRKLKLSGYRVIRVGYMGHCDVHEPDRYYCGDLTDEDFVNELLTTNSINYIIHAAAFWTGFNEDFAILHNNLLATLNLIKYCNLNLARFVHISSSAVYERGGSELEPDAVTYPDSSYGMSKALSERLIANRAGDKFPFTNWRPFHIASPVEKYNPGSSHLCTNLYHQVVNELLTIKLKEFDDEKIIPISWVEDVADVIVEHLDDKATDNEDFNIGNPSGATARGIATMFLNKAHEMGITYDPGVKCEFKKSDDNRFDKMKNALGKTLKTDAKDCVDYFLEVKYRSVT